jgi:hypothetical protein
LSSIFYLTRNTVFDIASQITSRITLALIALQIWRALSHTRIQGITEFKSEDYKGSTQDILVSFLPGHNLHLRYTLQNYEKPHRWLKEGIMRCALIAVSSALSMRIFITVLGGYILRTITLIMGKDIVPNEFKLRLNTLFKVHPEEIV